MIRVGLGNGETHKFPILPVVLNLDVWSATLVDDLEGEMLDSRLNLGIGEFTTNETLNVEDSGKAISILIDWR